MKFYDRYARGSHEARCNIPGVALAPGRGRCRKCGLELQARSVNSHEELCRGDADTNYTCRHCGANFLDLRLLRVHEFDCKRLADRRAAKAAAPLPPGGFPNEARPSGSGTVLQVRATNNCAELACSLWHVVRGLN